MVRFNLVDPKKLTDEHLRAEHVELIMLLDFINKYPNGTIPETYRMGTGHISFFRNKPITVSWRLVEVDCEMAVRNMNVNLIPLPILENDPHSEWIADHKDIKINAERIIDRLRYPKKKKNPWHYYGSKISNIEEFIQTQYGEYK